MDLACRFVAEGLGVSVVNALLAGLAADAPGLSVRPFHPRISYSLGLAASEAPAAPSLCEAFCEATVQAMASRVVPGGHVRLLPAAMP